MKIPIPGQEIKWPNFERNILLILIAAIALASTVAFLLERQSSQREQQWRQEITEATQRSKDRQNKEQQAVQQKHAAEVKP